MRFLERKEWLFDPLVFKRADTQTALKIQAEYVRKHSPRPPPQFFEIDRASQHVDTLWHVAMATRTGIARTIDIPAINFFEKPQWVMTQTGLVPKRNDKFWLAHNILADSCVDYFPERGDVVFWNGYRYAILNVVIPPEAYWQQTNVWLGLVVECAIVPEGDAKPLVNLAKVHPQELGPAGPLAAEAIRK